MRIKHGDLVENLKLFVIKKRKRKNNLKTYFVENIFLGVKPILSHFE